MHRVSIDDGPYPSPDAVAATSPTRSEPTTVPAIEGAIAANDVDGAAALTAKYGVLEHEPQALITRLTEIVCRDNATEMHALKHHQATVEEFQTTRSTTPVSVTWLPQQKPQPSRMGQPKRYMKGRNSF